MDSLLEVFNERLEGGEVSCEPTTAFFREIDVLEDLITYALSQPAGTLTGFLFAPSSIGCEPYSFIMMAEKRGVFKRHPDL